MSASGKGPGFFPLAPMARLIGAGPQAPAAGLLGSASTGRAETAILGFGIARAGAIV